MFGKNDNQFEESGWEMLETEVGLWTQAAAESTLHESADELADSTERPTLAPSATDATDPKRRLNFTCEVPSFPFDFIQIEEKLD